MMIDRVTETSDLDKKLVFGINNNSQEHETTNITTGDLVVLYENMELHDAIEISNKAPNQYVETVVYNDDLDSEVSDLSEIYSNEDISNVFVANNERIELLNSLSTFETTLCHKYGNVDMDTANLAGEFDKKNRLYNPFLNVQLNIHGMSPCKYSDSTIIPASLLDFICSKRLEDNYNFYMDNIIKYVQHTIEQLKRISNGDYLTDKAKEKWREINKNHKTQEDTNTAIMCCARIPVAVEGKVSEKKSTLDDIVHSEMDVRCLTKILEKKIIIEVPKVLCGTYKLFSRCRDDNLIISCKKEKQLTEFQAKDDSRVNVLLKLKRSNSGKVTTNINSIMVLKTKPIDTQKSEFPSSKMAVKIIDVTHGREQTTDVTEIESPLNDIDVKQPTSENSLRSLNHDFKENYKMQNKHDTEDHIETHLTTSADSNMCLITLDELGYTMRQLNVHSPVLEESEETYIKKKRSPTRVRIKSPYENRSHVIEEKKRKKLLEIREKRERKKNAMNESHKITKSKYGKAAIMAQASNSVTKLSITNKSFYNSIYGQTLNINNKNLKKNLTRQKKDNVSTDLDYDEEYNKDALLTPDKNSQKYINRSYYLDDADTEVKYLQKKLNGIRDETKVAPFPSTSTLSNDFDNFSILKKIISNTSATDLSCTDTTSSLYHNIVLEVNEDNSNDFLKPTQCTNVPTNTPNQNEHEVKNYKKIVTIECRKSIDKIYDLIKEKGDTEESNNCIYNEKRIKDNFTDVTIGKDSFITQASDSGISVKHQPISPNRSSSNFEKENNINPIPRSFIKHSIVTPKVIINSKIQARDLNNVMKKDAKRTDTNRIINNPLKAISQLIHDIDNVQKTRHKSGNDLKSTSKKLDSLNSEIHNSPRPLTYKKQLRNGNEANTPRHPVQNERRFLLTNDTNKSPRLPAEKSANRYTRKNMINIIEEVKELKGEAVRGPPKRSRLDSLAQPKKLYVQAQHEQYQNRHEKHYLTERQKSTNSKTQNTNRLKRSTEISTASNKQTIIGPSLEKSFKDRIEPRGNVDDREKLPVYAKRPPILNKTISTSDPLNKKMVAVETYVNAHFGRTLPPIFGNKQKPRVPLVPSNIDLGIDNIAESVTSNPGAEESTSLGKELHNMINSILNTNTKLPALTDYKESTTKSDKNDTQNEFDEDIVTKDGISASDYSVDVFEDKNIVTAVALSSNSSESNEIDKDTIKHVLKYTADSSEIEVQNLQNALCNQISNGTFHQRLRIKKLTLTPKHSMQQMIVLNSGYANSLLIKSTMSQKIDFSKSDMIELKLLPILSKNSLNRSLPIQVSTVGYAFPKYNEITNFTKHEAAVLQDIKTVQQSIQKENLCDGKIVCNMCTNNDSKVRNFSEMTQHKNVSTRCDSFECLNKSIETDFEKLGIVTENTEECKNDKLINLTDNQDNISNSTSLDILVGLLNEITKITSCQANIVNHSNEVSTIPKNKEFHVIHNNVSVPESTPDISISNSISLFSLISLNQKENSLINNVFDATYLNNDTTVTKKVKLRNLQPIFLDKEVTAKTSEKHIVHTLTDVPSRFFSNTVNESSEFINSVKVFEKNSSRSMSSFYDCCILHCNSSFHKTTTTPKFNQKVLLLSESTNKNKINEMKHYNAVTKNMMEHTKSKLYEFDPMMKIKRDILVTVYSVLVLTVFTALTFQHMLPLI